MKQLTLFAFSLVFASSVIAQVTPPDSSKKVQVAILFDTSNSMDGLIDQAKSRIWNIVNEISELRYEDIVPTMEFSLYEYGNDGLAKEDNYIRQLLDFTTDLDDVSERLFSLTTNGGSEYCGAVIQQSLDDLNWSNDQTDLKMIYIAGNEEFNQGDVDYKVACQNARSQSVYINSIFCGSYDDGVRKFWLDGSDCSGGDYFNIDSDKEVVHIETPYDKEINTYNDSLNSTYYGYGSLGGRKKSMQLSEDANAEMMAPTVSTDRAVAKSKKAVYSNESWDLLDAVEKGKDVSEIKEDDLPKEFKNKTVEEKEALIKEKSLDRERFQTKIGELAVLRTNFINEAKQKMAEEGEEIDDFGTSINESIEVKAKANGFSKKADKNE